MNQTQHRLLDANEKADKRWQRALKDAKKNPGDAALQRKAEEAEAAYNKALAAWMRSM